MMKINTKLMVLCLEILIILSFSVIAFMAVKAEAYYVEQSGYIRPASIPFFGNPPPTIDFITPNSVDRINEKLTITISGSGFTPDSVVKKNNSRRPATFIDSKTLLVDVYPGETSNGTDKFYLTVFNPQPKGGYSNASAFTIRDNVLASAKKFQANSSSGLYNNYNDVLGLSYQNSNSGNTVSKTASKTQPSQDYGSDINENYGSLTANALYGSNSFMPTGFFQWVLAIFIILVIIFLWRYIHGSGEKYMSQPMKHA